jgi:hypothetical protein
VVWLAFTWRRDSVRILDSFQIAHYYPKANSTDQDEYPAEPDRKDGGHRLKASHGHPLEKTTCEPDPEKASWP